jgi:hypothetical protein
MTWLAVSGQNAFATVAFTITPAAVSNTYSGAITLQVTGLTNGETVVVQKFLDANTNGVIDAGDLLWQQFTLTDGQAGMVVNGITNVNVPGDLDGSANGQINAKLNFQLEFSQTFAGKYLYKLSSPVGDPRLPLTNSFLVTNFPYAQKFTGTIVSNGVAVPNATVILFQLSGGSDLTAVAGTVANNSGSYTLLAPAGTYALGAVKTNFVANLASAQNLVLGSSATINTNLALIPATKTISGRVFDATTTNLGLGGLLIPVQSKAGFLGICFTDTNGNFSAGVTTNVWKIGGDSSSLAFHGYVGFQNKISVDTTTGSVSGVSIALPKATALFYGTVKDYLGNPLPGQVAIYASDFNNGLYQTDGYADTNGYYVNAVLGNLGSNDPWSVSVDNTSSYPNYNFSQPAFDQNNGTNIASGQAVLANITAVPASNHITGNVQAFGTNVVGVGVSAYATINGVNYTLNTVDTDANGNYSLTVANGTWSVFVNCQGGSDSLDNFFGSGNYQCPGNDNVTIANNNGVANFVVQSCSGVQIITPSPLPAAQQGTYYQTQLQGSDCNNNYIWSLNDPTNFPFAQSLNFSSSGQISGNPTGSGTYTFSVHLDDGNGHTTDASMSLTINPLASPLQITTFTLNPGTNGSFFTQTLQATGGQPPYTWSIPNYSANPPPNLNLTANGVLSGTLTTTGTFYFDVEVVDAASSNAVLTLSLYSVNPPAPPLVITNVSLPSGTIGAPYSAQLGATGGQPPYSWSLAFGSANPPTGLTLNPSGLISGTPVTNKTSFFKVQVMDSIATTSNKIFSITINPKPVLGSPGWANNQFQMQIDGASNQNYTLQVATNLVSPNWISVFSTNSTATNSFFITDPNATNQQRFYRLLLGP